MISSLFDARCDRCGGMVAVWLGGVYIGWTLIRTPEWDDDWAVVCDPCDYLLELEKTER